MGHGFRGFVRPETPLEAETVIPESPEDGALGRKGPRPSTSTSGGAGVSTGGVQGGPGGGERPLRPPRVPGPLREVSCGGCGKDSCPGCLQTKLRETRDLWALRDRLKYMRSVKTMSSQIERTLRNQAHTEAFLLSNNDIVFVLRCPLARTTPMKMVHKLCDNAFEWLSTKLGAKAQGGGGGGEWGGLHTVSVFFKDGAGEWVTCAYVQLCTFREDQLRHACHRDLLGSLCASVDAMQRSKEAAGKTWEFECRDAARPEVSLRSKDGVAPLFAGAWVARNMLVERNGRVLGNEVLQDEASGRYSSKRVFYQVWDNHILRREGGQVWKTHFQFRSVAEGRRQKPKPVLGGGGGRGGGASGGGTPPEDMQVEFWLAMEGGKPRERVDVDGGPPRRESLEAAGPAGSGAAGGGYPALPSLSQETNADSNAIFSQDTFFQHYPNTTQEALSAEAALDTPQMSQLSPVPASSRGRGTQVDAKAETGRHADQGTQAAMALRTSEAWTGTGTGVGVGVGTDAGMSAAGGDLIPESDDCGTQTDVDGLGLYALSPVSISAAACQTEDTQPSPVSQGTQVNPLDTRRLLVSVDAASHGAGARDSATSHDPAGFAPLVPLKKRRF